MRFKTTRNVKIDGKTYPAGTVVELPEEKSKPYLDEGSIRYALHFNNAAKYISKDELTRVKGVGEVISNGILNYCNTYEDLLSTDNKWLADRVKRLTESKVSEVKEVVLSLKE